MSETVLKTGAKKFEDAFGYKIHTFKCNVFYLIKSGGFELAFD
jgi:hypothetical protein